LTYTHFTLFIYPSKCKKDLSSCDFDNRARFHTTTSQEMARQQAHSLQKQDMQSVRKPPTYLHGIGAKS